MVSSSVTIQHANGVHARPASILVREAGKFQSNVTLSCNGSSVNGKSIMGLLMLALGPGSVVVVETDGPDEVEALEKITAVLSGNF